MAAFGYKQRSQGALSDGELGAESGPPGRDVGFSTDFVGSAPESRRGTSSRFSSARDPEQTCSTLDHTSRGKCQYDMRDRKGAQLETGEGAPPKERG